MQNDEDRKKAASVIRQFNRMYAPHEAREDTVLFPALHQVLSAKELASLGEQFEARVLRHGQAELRKQISIFVTLPAIPLLLLNRPPRPAKAAA